MKRYFFFFLFIFSCNNSNNIKLLKADILSNCISSKVQLITINDDKIFFLPNDCQQYNELFVYRADSLFINWKKIKIFTADKKEINEYKFLLGDKKVYLVSNYDNLFELDKKDLKLKKKSYFPENEILAINSYDNNKMVVLLKKNILYKENLNGNKTFKNLFYFAYSNDLGENWSKELLKDKPIAFNKVINLRNKIYFIVSNNSFSEQRLVEYSKNKLISLECKFNFDIIKDIYVEDEKINIIGVKSNYIENLIYNPSSNKTQKEILYEINGKNEILRRVFKKGETIVFVIGRFDNNIFNIVKYRIIVSYNNGKDWEEKKINSAYSFSNFVQKGNYIYSYINNGRLIEVKLSR